MLVFVILAAFFWTGTSNPAQGQTSGDAFLERGKALSEVNCSRCHAVESKDSSRHPDAPAFRHLLRRYPIGALEESFTDTIYSNHPDMPDFKVQPEQLEAILYLIATIQEP